MGLVFTFPSNIQMQPLEVYKKAVIENSAIFIGKHLCSAGLKAHNYTKRAFNTGAFL